MKIGNMPKLEKLPVVNNENFLSREKMREKNVASRRCYEEHSLPSLEYPLKLTVTVS